MPKSIQQLESLLQNNAETSEKMCRYYCALLLKTHITYLTKITMHSAFIQFKLLMNDYTILVS